MKLWPRQPHHNIIEYKRRRIIIIIIIFFFFKVCIERKREKMHGCILPTEDRQPYKANPRKEGKEKDNSGGQKAKEQLMIPSIWEAALGAERRCFTWVILSSNITPKIPWSTDSSTVPPRVNSSGDASFVTRKQSLS